MKLRNLFLASVACAGLFTACSNEMDEVIDGNNGTNNAGEAYASFAYTLPNSGAATRAQDTSGSEVGTNTENNVKEIAFILFNDADGAFKQVVTLDRSKFTPAGGGASTTYQTISPIKIDLATQNVYVVVNPSDAVKNFNGTRSAFQTSTEANFTIGEEHTMSNAEKIEKYTITPVAANTIQNPVKLTVPVERMAARIDYTTTKTDNKYDVVGSTGDKVQITNYRIVNKRTNAFLLKRVGTTANDAVIGASEAADSYVIDPIFAAKSAADFFTSATYTNGYSSRLDETTLTYVALPKALEAVKLAYCHENTMEANIQKNGAATGLVLKATYTPALTGLNLSGDFYRYNGKLYPSLKAMYEALNPTWATSSDKKDITVDVLGFKSTAETNFDTFAGTFDFDKLKAKYVDLYAGGVCYYTTYLRHINNNNNQSMGIMEYAIVRNNIYKLSINTVNKLGDPVPPTDPEPPVESSDTYLDVTVNVLNWTTRDNAVDL